MLPAAVISGANYYLYRGFYHDTSAYYAKLEWVFVYIKSSLKNDILMTSYLKSQRDVAS